MTRVRISVRRAFAVSALLVSTLPFQHLNTASAETLPPLGIVVRGHGNGHGRGLSQYGALGWATKLNASWQDILNFYYGGSGRSLALLTAADAGATPGGVMTVRLTALDGATTSVVSDNATLSWAGKPEKYGALVAIPVARNTYDIYASASATCSLTNSAPPGFTQIGDNVAGPIDFATTNGASPTAIAPTDLVGVCESSTSTYKSGKIRYYRGGIRALADSSGNHRNINFIPTEAYVRGVVPRESPAGWADQAGGLGINALRAQAVAARSYALSESRYSYAKTCDTQDCQVYSGAMLRGVGSTSVLNLEDSRSDLAVTDTANFVMKDSKLTIVRTEFTSSNGGRTAGGQFPAQVDNGDLAADAVLQSWTRIFSAAEIQKKYPTIGVFLSIAVTHDGLGGDWNGYATSVTITGSAGVVTRSGWLFRGDFDLYAPWFEATPIAAADSTLAPVGSMLFVGDSVSESIAAEFSSIITPAYPTTNFQACSGRAMAGADCLFTVAPPQLDLDGVGIVNSSETPAIAVVALGYNDDPNTFDAKVQQMMSALTSKSIQRIVFVNLSTRSTSRSYAKSNAALLAVAATNPTVSILDWNAASSAANQWRWFDNSSLCCWVHLNTTGQAEFALFLRAQFDALRAQGLLPTTASTAAVIPGLPLEMKNTGVMVQSIQKKLNAVLALKGKKRLMTDGQFGTGTANAVKAFQATAALPVTGIVDRATWDAIGFAGRIDLAVLKVGTKHAAVSSIQRALAKVLKKKIKTTGIFTSSLANDVKTFQKRVSLKANGRVGPSTWTSLMATAALV
jgi:peptidoglycan hydrolase-like protein with peptidoglycan-binding domain